MGHDARRNYWVKNSEQQTWAVRKNEDINKKLSIWLLGLYFVSFHHHGITPSPSETGRDQVSVTQGSSYLCNSQNVLNRNMPACNFAEKVDYFLLSPTSCSIKIQFYGATFPMDMFCHLFPRHAGSMYVLLANAET